MKNKLTAILALLLAAVMLAGCTAHVENQDNDKDNENIDISVKVTPTVEPTVEPTPQIMKMTLFTDMVEEYGSREKADEALYYNKNEDWVSIDKKSDYKIPVYGYDDILFLDYKNKTNNVDIIAGWDNFAVKLTANHSIEVTAHFGNPWRLTLLTFFYLAAHCGKTRRIRIIPILCMTRIKGIVYTFAFVKACVESENRFASAQPL